ncbi:MAG: alpha/beta hydrolase [Maricaulaceae bacterium]|jgi:pimeloyl-ACP methyl ester carboxylesterase
MIRTEGLKKFAATSVALGALIGCASTMGGGEPVQLAGVECTSPPPLHCPEAGCPDELIGNPGNAADPATYREFYLDYPCDLRPGEAVTFVLNLHGGGSIANWQRHYFPIMDYKEEYRLVVATPSGTSRGWRADPDDQHLRNIVEMVEAELAANDVAIDAFWLAGHSFGGQTSNRLINDDPFFYTRIDGWVSLSGGRLGSRRADVRAGIPRGSVAGGPPPRPERPPAAEGECVGLAACAEFLPETAEFSFIYETGEHELTDAGLPNASPWAAQLGCDVQANPREIVDTTAGYVYDGREQANRNPVWGLDPRPGTALIYDYPNCDDGRIVADVVRLDKGHTEGLEPEITEEIVRMMMAAR